MSEEKKLHLSWHDTAWIPILQPSNVLEYFSQRSNPFYDRTCNNEVVRMQRRDLSVLKNMTGLEYELLHVQGNFLYIVRKQFRHSPTEVTPQANYYILNGIVYQAPDLHAVVNSRTFSALYHLTRAFDEVLPRTRYHPTSGYLWDFEQSQLEDFKKKEATADRSRQESNVQQQCIRMILEEVRQRFPPQYMARPQALSADGKTAVGTPLPPTVPATTGTVEIAAGAPGAGATTVAGSATATTTATATATATAASGSAVAHSNATAVSTDAKPAAKTPADPVTDIAPAAKRVKLA